MNAGYCVFKAWRSWSCVSSCVRLLALCVRSCTFLTAAPCQYAGRAHENPTLLRFEYTTFQKLPLTKSDPAWHPLCWNCFAFDIFQVGKDFFGNNYIQNFKDNEVLTGKKEEFCVTCQTAGHLLVWGERFTFRALFFLVTPSIWIHRQLVPLFKPIIAKPFV